MADGGIGNPAGAVVLFDFSTPHIIPGYARGNLSGGAFCFGSTANGVVSSGPNSFSTGSMLFAPTASGQAFNGVSMYDAGSNTPCAIALGGIIIGVAVGSIFGGHPVALEGNNSFTVLGSSVVPDAATHWGTGGKKVGRAITDGASGGYAVIQLTP